MFTQKASYILNSLLISYYNPLIYTEKVLLSTLIVMINLNCVLFFYLFIVFIFTMKYDIYYVNLQLELIPEIEFFSDAEEEYLKKKMGKFIEI